MVLHGFLTTREFTTGVASLLAPRRVVAVDWFGYGRSDRVEPGSVDGGQYQDGLRSVLDSLELGPVGLVAHGVGP